MIETIYALASAPGKAGVSILRVSGPQALHSFHALTGRNNPVPRQSYLCTLSDPVSRETIDKALTVFFESPSSFTGEDVAEYYLHGSRAVTDKMMDVLSNQGNHRLAMPGEFTRRAFENGKLDLTEAEAVADLINAQTQLQRNQALRQLEGGLKILYEKWCLELTKILAYLEADLEFPDEDDAIGAAEKIRPQLENLISDLDNHLQDNRRGEILRDGFRICIIGAPNAGKSSLMNVLAKRDVAIVSDIAGTTRDVIEVYLDLDGYPVVLFDTAGLRQDRLDLHGQDYIEAEGIKRTVQQAQQADLKILLYDGQQAEPDPLTLSFTDDNSLALVSKSDLPIKLNYPAPHIQVSSTTSEGIPALLDKIRDFIAGRMGGSEQMSLTRLRHRHSLEECRASLQRSIQRDILPELVAEDVRLAIRALGQITGRVDVEDILDVVFRDFCIGK